MTSSRDPRPGFKWPVSVTRSIPAAAEEVWTTISTPGHLKACHPFCKENPVRAWPGASSHDEVHYLNGWVFERRFRRWIDGIGYDLEIGRRGGGSSFVTWRITPAGPKRCSLTLTVYPHPLQQIPVVLRWIPHLMRVRPMLKSYLSSVVRGIEWFVTRGEPVAPNQFGEHPWFSRVR